MPRFLFGNCMKKKIFFVLFIIILFISCNKKTSLLKNKENIIFEENIEINLNDDIDINSRETEIIEIFNDPDPVKIGDIFLEKPLNKEFPEIFNYDSIPKYEYDISRLSTEQLDFYNKYVGSYFYKSNLDPLFLSRNVYNMEINCIINNIKFYSFYRNFNGITYYENETNIPFAMCDSYAVWQLKSYEFTTDLIKIESNSFFEDIIRAKEIKSSTVKNMEYDEEEIKLLIKNAFDTCDDSFDDEELLKFFDVDLFRIINRNNEAEMIKETEIYRLLKELSFMLKMIDGKFDLYSNVYFSEDFDLVNDIFGECILIEFKCNSLDYYGSLIIKKINNGYKIVSIRVNFDLV